MSRDDRRGGRRQGVQERSRGAAVKWLGLACLVVLALSGLFLILVEDPQGGEPVVVAKIGAAPATGETQAAPGFRRSIDRDAAVDPLPQGHSVAPADIVISDPMAGRQRDDRDLVPALVEPGEHGPLPKIAPDGRTPATAYAAAPPPGKSAMNRIAIVVGGLGLSTSTTETAIATLPAGVTLAFAPYGREVERLAASARQEGHELLLQVPMEPYDFPDNDPGPQTLLTGLDTAQNRDRLHWSMARFGGYVGITNYMGARFTATETGMRPLLEELKGRGLLYVGDGSSQRSIATQVAREIGLGSIEADEVIDATPREEEIRAALAELERRAAEEGSAIGVATGLPVTIETIADWAEELERRGAVIVPVSAVVGAPAS